MIKIKLNGKYLINTNTNLKYLKLFNCVQTNKQWFV